MTNFWWFKDLNNPIDQKKHKKYLWEAKTTKINNKKIFISKKLVILETKWRIIKLSKFRSRIKIQDVDIICYLIKICWYKFKKLFSSSLPIDIIIFNVLLSVTYLNSFFLSLWKNQSVLLIFQMIIQLFENFQILLYTIHSPYFINLYILCFQIYMFII